ncbi:GAF domain containing protein [Thermaurantimonas aggregans]|uniref:GAF domain containing protein n=1 Tax=Thermaurantimonas aggregans TaxID=2173829 RepID=A0A401XI57_9FLAO|nr:GAF domain-containing protein [Thermaurantimonas aggregans]MCX8149280.1 GAF domain-containing protein [Thermaurantimonas aggregans]GCD76678.1 GAF domain containing protein [Thermaurantimonas aggregans]
MKETFEQIKNRISALLDSENTAEERLLEVCKVINSSLPHMDWVGFYFMNDEKQVLELGPFVGEPTDHTVIPYGRGICGQVAVSGTTLNVADVSQSDNYLACSLATKSEIVIPLNDGAGKLIGQLDIDSHVLNRFDDETSAFLEEICQLISQKVYTSQSV